MGYCPGYVLLADIPLVQLRDRLPERLHIGQASFTQAVATANRGLKASYPVLNVEVVRAWADDEALELLEAELFLLLWLAERAVRGESAKDWSRRAMAGEFACGRRMAYSMSGHDERIVKAFTVHDYFSVKTAKDIEARKSLTK